MPRSLSVRTEDELGGALSVLTLQRRDHQRLDLLLERVANTTGSQLRNALTELCRLVFPHAFAEEAVLWPLVRRTLPNGPALTLRVEQQHQEINELFAELERTDSASRQRTRRAAADRAGSVAGSARPGFSTSACLIGGRIP